MSKKRKQAHGFARMELVDRDGVKRLKRVVYLCEGKSREQAEADLERFRLDRWFQKKEDEKE